MHIDEIQLKQFAEKQQVLFILLRNLMVEVQGLRTEVRDSNLLFLRLLDDPETKAHAEKIIKDYKIHKQ